jgi:hypothetical protein
MTTKKNKRTSLKKRGGNNKTKKCMDTKCELWLKEAAKNVAIFKKVIEKGYKKALTKVKKECESKTKKEEVCEKLEKDVENLKKMLDGFNDKKTIEKGKKLELNTCKTMFCNEGCKGTILEDGPADTLPKSLVKKYKDSPGLIDLFKNMRKEVFGNKTSVLKNDFFEKMKLAHLNKYKKEGAISGCIRN